MPIESIPKFTDPAAQLWATIPIEAKKQLLANVWYGKWAWFKNTGFRVTLA